MEKMGIQTKCLLRHTNQALKGERCEDSYMANWQLCGESGVGERTPTI